MIYTFYSFKGGVGRSMALANIAEVLCAKKLNVLLVDFDLEAPGLERYFGDVLPAGVSLSDVGSHAGMIDLLSTYQELRAVSAARTVPKNASLQDRMALLPVPPFANYVVTIREKRAGQGSISLITAGKRLENSYNAYAKKVLSFFWDEFYLSQEGELFFEWFRSQAEQEADAILIDSRTGVTEMTGVCTHQLADVVLSFVAANAQNQDGVLQTMRGLIDPALIKDGRHGRALSQILVPSRVEISEGDQAKRFQDDLQKRVGEAFPQGVPGQGAISFDIAIPYVPVFAFNERVAAREVSHPLAKLMVEPMERLAALMAKFAPANSRMYLKHHSSTEILAKLAEELVAGWGEEKQLRTRAVLGRLIAVSISRQGSSYSFSTRQVQMEEFPGGATDVIRELEGVGLLSIEVAGKDELVSFADPQLPTAWERLNRWILQDQHFLDWLQRVSAGGAEWRASGNSLDLLSGTPLEDARKWMREKALAINAVEMEYLEASQAARQSKQRADETLPAVEVERATKSARQAASSPLDSLSPMAIRRQPNAQVAVVFVHGGGDAKAIWGQFPELLRDDSRLTDWDIYSVGCAASLEPDLLGIWRENVPIDKLAMQFGMTCRGFLSGYRALALLGHGLSGLVIQRALLDDTAVRGQVSHMFLFATPSGGLVKAGAFSFLKRQARDLGERSKFIVDLRRRWRELFADKPPFQCFVVAGDLDQFVPPSSSIAVFPKDQRYVLPGNHLQIVNASSADSFCVKLVLEGLLTGSARRGEKAEASLAIEDRQFDKAIEMLWPVRDTLDEKGRADLAIALQQAGRQDEAIHLLVSGGEAELDAILILAGRLKGKWLAERRRPDAEGALRLYNQGYQTGIERGRPEQAMYSGINLAFMQLAYLSDIESARETASRVLALCISGKQDVWTLATEGEAYLLLSRTQEALSKYQQVVHEKPEAAAAESICQEALRVADLTGDEDALRELPLIFELSGMEEIELPAS